MSIQEERRYVDLTYQTFELFDLHTVHTYIHTFFFLPYISHLRPYRHTYTHIELPIYLPTLHSTYIITYITYPATHPTYQAASQIATYQPFHVPSLHTYIPTLPCPLPTYIHIRNGFIPNELCLTFTVIHVQKCFFFKKKWISIYCQLRLGHNPPV